jgi:hypothetical protein
MSVREQILLTVFGRLAGAFAAGTTPLLTRNAAFAERIDEVDTVWFNLMDGPRVQPTALLGGGWEFDHRARLQIWVRGEDDADRDQRFDASASRVAEVLTDDGLDGLVDLCVVEPPEEPAPEVLDFAVGLKVAELPILFLYTAPTEFG